MRGGLCAIVALAVCACASAPRPAPHAEPPPPPPAAPPPPPVSLTGVKLGPLVVTVSDGRTAQVFHVVDALARAGGAAHAVYAGWAETGLPLDDAERAMLAWHTKLRARRGASLDQAFYVASSLDDAAKHAVDAKLLLGSEADAERALLAHFAPRLEAFLDAGVPALKAFEEALSDALKGAAPLASQLGRFCETSESVEVSAFLVPSPAPSSAVSAWAGGRLAVEAGPEQDDVPTFMHALFHAVLERRRGSFAVAAAKCDESIDPETMEEGVAYAFAPGLVHAAGRDVLLAMVDEDRSQKLGDRFVRYERLGLAVRTDLERALEGGHDTLGAFLPTECEAWAKIAKP